MGPANRLCGSPSDGDENFLAVLLLPRLVFPRSPKHSVPGLRNKLRLSLSEKRLKVSFVPLMSLQPKRSHGILMNKEGE